MFECQIYLIWQILGHGILLIFPYAHILSVRLLKCITKNVYHKSKVTYNETEICHSFYLLDMPV